MNKNHLRLIDANLNRLREGIRVVEDIFRYIYNNKEISTKLKSLRHIARTKNYYELLETISYKLEFDNKKELFDYIKKSGVSGKSELNFEKAKKLYKEYNLNYLEFEVIFVKTISKL